MPPLRIRELLLDLLGILEPLLNLLPALLEHGQDRLVGEVLQQHDDDDEAAKLREKRQPVEPEGLACAAHEFGQSAAFLRQDEK